NRSYAQYSLRGLDCGDAVARPNKGNIRELSLLHIDQVISTISAESEAHGSGRRAPGSRARNDVRRRGDDMQSADKPHASDSHKAYGYDTRDDAHDIYGRRTRLGLAAHALELDIKGLTVIPPETV